MHYFETCHCCRQKKTAYTLAINAPLVNAFIKFAVQYLKDGKGIVKGEIGLTNAQYSNFQNLRHFGIIRQYEKGNEWYLTDIGLAFYYGEIGIKSPIAFMAGETLPDNHPCWATEKKKRETVYIRDVMPGHYKKRPEYQRESTRQTSFL